MFENCENNHKIVVNRHNIDKINFNYLGNNNFQNLINNVF